MIGFLFHKFDNLCHFLNLYIKKTTFHLYKGYYFSIVIVVTHFLMKSLSHNQIWNYTIIFLKSFLIKNIQKNNNKE